MFKASNNRTVFVSPLFVFRINVRRTDLSRTKVISRIDAENLRGADANVPFVLGLIENTFLQREPHGLVDAPRRAVSCDARRPWHWESCEWGRRRPSCAESLLRFQIFDVISKVSGSFPESFSSRVPLEFIRLKKKTDLAIIITKNCHSRFSYICRKISDNFNLLDWMRKKEKSRFLREQNPSFGLVKIAIRVSNSFPLSKLIRRDHRHKSSELIVFCGCL